MSNMRTNYTMIKEKLEILGGVKTLLLPNLHPIMDKLKDHRTERITKPDGTVLESYTPADLRIALMFIVAIEVTSRVALSIMFYLIVAKFLDDWMEITIFQQAEAVFGNIFTFFMAARS